jgi:glycosyltransferase involved in cell wall biosynthesis
VVAWPVGIDTDFWAPPNHRTIAVPKHRRTDFLIYDKVRWEHERYEEELLQPIRSELTKRGLRFCEIRYGFYKEGDFHHLLGLCKAMLFVCTHETQGIAYQQALSAGVPILAWDRGGICADPNLLRLGVCFGPVSSVPYWDSRCGMKFADVTEFPSRLDVFWDHVQQDAFQPRDYILENLTLEKCARHYLEICNQVTTSPNAKPKQILHETAETTEG